MLRSKYSKVPWNTFFLIIQTTFYNVFAFFGDAGVTYLVKCSEYPLFVQKETTECRFDRKKICNGYPSCTGPLYKLHLSIYIYTNTIYILTLVLHVNMGGSMSQVVGLPNNSYKPITNRRGFAPGFVNYKKGCTRLAASSDKSFPVACPWSVVLSEYSGFFYH